jgi:hypothetical protein
VFVGARLGFLVGEAVGKAVSPGWQVKHNVLLFVHVSKALLKRASAIETSETHKGSQSKPG